MKIYDVAVIGGGPAGLSAATSASRFNADTILFEEHESIGLPWHCAGVVSSRMIRYLNLGGSEKTILSSFDTVDVYLSLRYVFSIRSSIPQLVLDRAAFDRFLADRASSYGVKLILRSRVRSLNYADGNLIDISTDGSSYKCRIAILAEGLPGVLARSLGFNLRKLTMLPSIQYLVHVAPNLDMGIVEVHLLQGLSPPFFAWVIPIDKGVCRVGLASYRSTQLKPFIEAFLSRRFNSWRMISKSRWLIPIGGPLDRTVKGHVILVGDVAGQAKPTTGGGIISSIACGMIAGSIAGSASVEDEYSILDQYESLWRSFFDFKFKIQKIARKAVDRMRWTILSSMVESISDMNREFRVVDLDTQIDLISKLISSPRIVFTILKSLLKL
ncbi:MAG: NAD(P)/FAD-dependent oxidoreductase [Candidatus Bathyarchaeia archaeon]